MKFEEKVAEIERIGRLMKRGLLTRAEAYDRCDRKFVRTERDLSKRMELAKVTYNNVLGVKLWE